MIETTNLYVLNNPGIVNNPIIVVDDDQDDIQMIAQTAEDLNIQNELVFLNSGEELIQYLRESDRSPFMVICDINLPRQNGFAIRDLIEQDKLIRYKSVPFLFWSTSALEYQVRSAYDKHSQGVFIKPTSFGELQDFMKIIIAYWQLSLHPKSK